MTREVFRWMGRFSLWPIERTLQMLRRLRHRFGMQVKSCGPACRPTMTKSARALTEIDGFLTAITGRLLQISNRKANAMLGATASGLFGSALSSTIAGAVGAFGSASTGTAIAGLAGAAKSSATLYWIGGWVGGGVAAGSLILGAGAVGAGVYGSFKLRRAVFGLSRNSALSAREERIVLAIDALRHSIRRSADAAVPVSDREILLFGRIGLKPLIDELENALTVGDLAGLTFYNRARLRGHLINLRKLLARLET